MILTFLMRRRSAIKVLGSTIDAAIRRKHTCFLWRVPDGKEPFLVGDFVRWPLLYKSPTWRPLGTVIGLDTDPDAHVGVAWWFDNLLKHPREGAETQCYISQFHRDLHTKLYCTKVDKPIVGWSLADHRALLPPRHAMGQLVDVLFTMKRRVPETWRTSMVGRIWYWEQVMRVRRESRGWGVPLVVKTKYKNGDPFWMRYAGKRYWDHYMYPSTSLMLLQNAFTAHHFMSGAHVEARLMNVPVSNYRVPMGHISHLPGYKEVYEMTMNTSMSREEYGQHMWGGFDDTGTGERVMDVVEERYG